MLLKSIRLQRYRCVLDGTVVCDKLTSIVGANGTGKSTFLHALELFYATSPKVSQDDFFAGDITKEMSISVTYADLSVEAQALFNSYIQGGTLTVEKVFFTHNDKIVAKYYGAKPRCLQFRSARQGLEIKDRGKTARAAYEAVAGNPPFTDLPAWSTIGEAASALTAWEDAHPEACKRERDDGQFFSFAEVGEGRLNRFTQLLYIPAVRDAATDALDARGSALTALLDLIVRSALINKAAFQRLAKRSQALYARLVTPDQLSELSTLGSQLTGLLRVFVPETSVTLSWRPLEEISLPMPSADIRLSEGDYETPVDRTGHGLQRAFILTMLQQLATARNAAAIQSVAATGPNLILAIEEPELYQHPLRQRHFAKTLRELTEGVIGRIVQNTQVIFTTHSPLFVNIEHINEIRLLRRVAIPPENPKSTSVVSTDLDKLAEVLWDADGRPGVKFTGATLSPRLRTIMSPWVNEGFFAEMVVLVEGQDDRSGLLATAEKMKIDFDKIGVAVLPCGGKTCLDRPYAIFTQLGIPTYLIWDGDKDARDAKPADNHRLLRLLGETPVDWPSGVFSEFACFERDLEATMIDEITETVYEESLVAAQAEFGIPKRKHAQKNPAIIASVLDRANIAGKTCKSLEAIVTAIVAWRQTTPAPTAESTRGVIGSTPEAGT